MKKKLNQNSISDTWNKVKSGLVLFLISFALFANAATMQTDEQQRVTGIVVDEKTGETIIGATVKVQGTKQGTVTDIDGKFSIQISDSHRTNLLVTYVGYKPQLVSINGKSEVKVMLEDNTELKEVVVTAYGTETRGSSSSAQTTVNSKNINITAQTGIDNALQGGVPGLTVNMSSAAPGASADINLRGRLSPDNGVSNSPLFVIDGVPIFDDSGAKGGGTGGTTSRSPLSTINPTDIESVTVLKDASATAIYGSAASNGVILVTTKSGKTGETKVNYDGKFSIQNITSFYQPLSTNDYMNYSNLNERESQMQLAGVYPYGSKSLSAAFPSSNSISYPFKESDFLKYHNSYNHVNDITRVGNVSEHNVSFSGGKDGYTYYLSFGAYNQKSILKSTDFNRYNGRIKTEMNLSKFIKFSLNTMFSYVDAANAAVGNPNNGSLKGNLETGTAISYSPLLPLFDASGIPTIDYINTLNTNPGIYQRISDRTSTERFMIAPQIEIKLTKDLKFQVRSGLDYSLSHRGAFTPTGSVLPSQIASNYNSGTQGYWSSYNSNVEGFFDYSKTFNSKHYVVLVAGVGGYYTGGENLNVNLNNLGTDLFKQYNMGDFTVKDKYDITSNKYESTKYSEFGRFTYTYDSRYGLSSTLRIDGSTNFSNNHKFGVFPGVSGNWNISEEKFIKESVIGAYISNLKLRLGWGTTGNESGTMASNPNLSFAYLDKFIGPYWGNAYFFGGKYVPGMTQSNLANPNLKWETDEMINIGLDFAIFKDRISGVVEVYQRTAYDLLQRTLLPSNTFVTQILRNVGSTRAKGIELGLNFAVIKSTDFSWDISVNGSHVYTNWISRDPSVPLDAWVGKNDEMNAIYGWKSTGTLFKDWNDVEAYNKANDPNHIYNRDDKSTWFQQSIAGQPKFIDQNNDGKMDAKDIVKLGTWDPMINFGLRSNIKYKSIDFSVQTYGVINVMAFDDWTTNLPSTSGLANVDIHALNQWSSFNPNGTYRIKSSGLVDDQANNKTYVNDYGLKYISFIRLKSITIGYNFKMGGKLKFVKSLRVFADANNLGILTNYSGLDPELGRDLWGQKSSSPFPITATYTLGASISF